MITEESTIDRIRTRPRFKVFTSLSPEEYSVQLKKFLAADPQFSGNINRESATIYVKTEHNEFWKPYLSLRTEKENSTTAIRGIFGPSSAVWTFFMFLYFIWGILWMVFITLWFVGIQIRSQDYHWGLPMSFVVLILGVLTYLAARYGQKKGKSEMELLRKFAIESTLPFEKKETKQHPL